MHRLTCIRERERGAIAAIVAMLFGFGVMLSLAALTVDVGNINADRRQLQNGADAVAFAVAQQCANTGTCTPNAANLQALVNSNAADGATSIRRVDNGIGTTLAGARAICGTAPGLTACPTTWTAGISNLQECPSVTLPDAAKYVRVYAETKNSAGGNLLPYYFGAAITGISGANQQACATVGYGNGKLTGPVLPIAMSYCEWKAATGADPLGNPKKEGTYVDPPDYSFGVASGYDSDLSSPTPSWPAATEKEIYTAKSVPAAGCTTWNGHVTPGNFSALTQSPNGSCKAKANEWMVGDTGNDSPCSDDQLTAYRGKIVTIPLFDCIASSTAPLTPGTDCQDGGSGANYHITGYASFYLTGWQFSGTSNPYDRSIKDNHKLCQAASGNSGRCLSGWFTRSMKSAGELDQSDAPGFGTSVIQMLG